MNIHGKRINVAVDIDVWKRDNFHCVPWVERQIFVTANFQHSWEENEYKFTIAPFQRVFSNLSPRIIVF